MGKAHKILTAMENNPLDWHIEQVKTVAAAFGLTVHCTGGSHHVVRHPDGGKVSVPAHRPFKAVYIKTLSASSEQAKETKNDRPYKIPR